MAGPLPTAAVALAVAALAFAGCLEASEGPVPTADRSADLSQPAERMPGPRAVVAAAQMHEEVDGAVVDLPFADGDDGWEPRDVELTYHGIQEVHDEFARLTPAYVFRYPHMVFVEDSTTFSSDGIDIDGHYEAHTIEFHFDAADGRLLGLVDVDEQYRAFKPPNHRDPFGTLAVVSMAFKVFEATGRAPIFIWETDGHTLHYDFQPYTETVPLAGDCTPWEIVDVWEPEWPEDAADLVSGEVEEEARALVCMESGREVPLWTWAGTSKGSYRLLRTGGDVATPPFEGLAMAPVAYERAGWQEVSGPLPVPGPLLVPPTSDGGLWAQEVAERAAALYFSPGYLKYRLASETPYVDIAFLGIDFGSLLGLPLPLPPVPLLGDRSSRVSLYGLTDSETRHFHLVTTLEGEPEGPDVHVAEPQGYDSPEFGDPMAASELPPLVTDGDFQGQLAPLIPERADLLVFIFFSYPQANGTMESIAQWSAIQDCSQTEDGWAAALDGKAGHAWLVQKLPAGNSACGELAAQRSAEPLRSTTGVPSGLLSGGPGLPVFPPVAKASRWA